MFPAAAGAGACGRKDSKVAPVGADGSTGGAKGGGGSGYSGGGSGSASGGPSGGIPGGCSGGAAGSDAASSGKAAHGSTAGPTPRWSNTEQTWKPPSPPAASTSLPDSAPMHGDTAAGLGAMCQAPSQISEPASETRSTTPSPTGDGEPGSPPAAVGVNAPPGGVGAAAPAAPSATAAGDEEVDDDDDDDDDDDEAGAKPREAANARSSKTVSASSTCTGRPTCAYFDNSQSAVHGQCAHL